MIIVEPNSMSVSPVHLMNWPLRESFEKDSVIVFGIYLKQSLGEVSSAAGQ